MSWYLTWQDPIAWAVVALGLGLVWRWRAGQSTQACGSCGEPDAEAKAGRVGLKETRLAGRLKE